MTRSGATLTGGRQPARLPALAGRCVVAQPGRTRLEAAEAMKARRFISSSLIVAAPRREPSNCGCVEPRRRFEIDDRRDQAAVPRPARADRVDGLDDMVGPAGIEAGDKHVEGPRRTALRYEPVD